MHSYTEYFKERKQGFDRLLKKIYEKYRSLSRFSGTVKLVDLTIEEADTLSRFFGTSYQAGNTVSISVQKFLRVMEDSKFEEFDPTCLLEEYFHISLKTKKDEKEKLSQEEWIFYQSIIRSQESIASSWLNNIIEKRIAPYKLLQQRYHRDKKELKRELLSIMNLTSHLPEEKTPLAIYSSTYTKDPHYLDLEGNHSILFLYVLSYIDGCEFPKTREDKIILLSKYNIEVDFLSNYVLTYSLLSSKEYMNGFINNQESLILNTQNIISTEWFDTSSKKVFVFENPSILTEVLSKKMDVSVIISSGFPNSSVYLLIDKLLERGNILYYNGDFDPEGLIIAQKLKNRYGNKIHFICYESSDYNACISTKYIQDARLHKLEKVTDAELQEIKNLLLKNKYAAYQENNKDRIIKFISSIIKLK